MTSIPSSLPTVHCPKCERDIPLSGLYGQVIPWHRKDPTRQPPCSGQGTPVPRSVPLEVTRG